MGAEANLSHLVLIKTQTGWGNGDQETIDFHQKIKAGDAIHADFKRMRKPKFHRRFFAMLQLAFEYWEPGEIDSKFGTPEKSFDRFRQDLTILAGYYQPVIRLDGTVRIEAKSISFGSMEQDEFEQVYNQVLNVILKKIPVLNELSAKEINDLVDRFLSFT